MTTDRDILAALRGEPSPAKQRADESILRALEGGPSAAEQASNAAILAALHGESSTYNRAYADAITEAYADAITEASGRTPARQPGADELPVKKRDFEAVEIWAAKESVNVAKVGLRDNIMRTTGKSIWAAEAEAEEIAEEAYANAARGHHYESDRLKAVERILNVLAKPKAGRTLRETGAALSRVMVSESTATAAPTGTGLMTIRIINEGIGSSGIYPAATLEQAAKDKVFAKGLHLFINHPTQIEDFDRPERSVKDLAGVLETDAVYRGGALYAEAKVFPEWRQRLTDMAEHIGVSIRAFAEKENDIVTKLYQAQSVDFVTRAGRGGAIVSVN